MAVFLVPRTNFNKMVARLVFVVLLVQSTFGQKHDSKRVAEPWQTLNGEKPAVIARGGYTGLFLEGSALGIGAAMQLSSPGVTIHCTLQLSQDNVGFCLSSLDLANITDIAQAFPQSIKTHNVNGRDVQGFFALDYSAQQLSTVYLTQSIYSRPCLFDGNISISSIDQVLDMDPPSFWLNVEYSNFYSQNKLDPALYIETLIEQGTSINYISSPEIKFLKKMNVNPKVNKDQTKLIFTLLSPDEVEPTTNQTYGSFIEDLNSIKMFASGIMVHKHDIWPVNDQMYLDQAPKTLVMDAHKAGLLVYAYPFANDMVDNYNYSFDPNAEYLQFVDNSQFSVDGFLTDFPATASGAISCLAHNKRKNHSNNNNNARRRRRRRPMVISLNGASGVFPGCTDLAYQQAVDDGADIIDCSVQLSKDGVAFCMNSTDLSSTTSAKTTFLTRSATIPEIQRSTGIFSFDLTWAEILTLKPIIASPFESATGVKRNPANKSKGKFLTLAEFLDFAKLKNVSGILINIENAGYLASKKGLSITGAIAAALSNANLDKQPTQQVQVLIQSDDSGVLSKFSNINIPSYKRVLAVKKKISNIPQPTLHEIKKYADAVNVHTTSIIAVSNSFTTYSTGIVEQLHKANLSVYASGFVNEYVAIAQDYGSDPMTELATHIAMGVDAVITTYPATATAFLRSPCSNPKVKLEYKINPIKPGDYLSLAPDISKLLPVQASAPPLQVEDAMDAPIPSISTTDSSSAAASPNIAPVLPPNTSSQAPNANLQISTLVVIMTLSLLSLVC